MCLSQAALLAAGAVAQKAPRLSWQELDPQFQQMDQGNPQILILPPRPSFLAKAFESYYDNNPTQ